MNILSVKYEARPTFELAAADAGEGYENTLLIHDLEHDPYDYRDPRIEDFPAVVGHSMAAIAVAKAFSDSYTLNIVDVGGSIGTFFAIAKKTFGYSFQFSWKIVETPMYVKNARKFIREDGLSFIENIDVLSKHRHDLLHVSGVLGYVSDYKALLSHPVFRSAPFIFISRTGLYPFEIPYLQTVTYDLGTVRYPGRILNKDEVFSILSDSHEIHTSWQDQIHFGEILPHAVSAPSMLWRRKDIPILARPGSLKRSLLSMLRR